MSKFTNNFRNFFQRKVFLTSSVAAGSTVYYLNLSLFNKTTSSEPLKPDVKYFTRAEVSKFKSPQTGIYVSHGKNVYDITKFVEQHPGGSKILLAAGKSVDPFWNHYRQHLNDHVEKILDEYKIGELSDYDPNEFITLSPYVNDPERVSDLSFHSHEPCNAEANLDVVDEDENPLGPLEYYTPNEVYFIRNHHPVPEIENLENYKISIEGIDFTFKDLVSGEKFKNHTITTTMQCGGNRRCEFNDTPHGKTSGTAWKGRAISTAKWQGCWLRDIILKIDPEIAENEEKKQNRWVTVKSIDDLEISIPIEKVLNPNGDVMLAHLMNGEAIPRDHGFPIRLIVPGYAGIRNVKWVKSIKITDEEVQSPWQTGIAYKMLPHYSKKATQKELDTLKTTLEAPVTSAITSNPELIQEAFKNNPDQKEIEIFGYAWSGGGRGIQRVEVSQNGGKTWQTAELVQGQEQNPYKAWAWTLWKAKISREEAIDGKLNLCCKAVDMGYNTQPEDIKLIWNLRGINNNSWHFVEVEI